MMSRRANFSLHVRYTYPLDSWGGNSCGSMAIINNLEDAWKSFTRRDSCDARGALAGARRANPQGAKEFPFDAVLDVLNSKHSYEDKVTRILAISGTWMNTASGSQWALGPLSSTAYSERVGIGVRWGEIAFSPLLNVAGDLIDAYPTWPGVLREFAQNQEFSRDHFSQRLKEI